jgi:ADP-ribose pyrophosphatase YjhB (NUDIX family)
MNWRRIHLCTGILERDGCILLVASRYPNQPHALWNLPGGRQESPETVEAAVVREFAEETALAVRVRRLAYVAESFDFRTQTQFTNFAFIVAGTGDARVPPGDAHAVACEWVDRADLARRLTVGVVREPLLAYLRDPRRQYFGYADAGISIEFADEPRARASEFLARAEIEDRRTAGLGPGA